MTTLQTAPEWRPFVRPGLSQRGRHWAIFAALGLALVAPNRGFSDSSTPPVSLRPPVGSAGMSTNALRSFSAQGTVQDLPAGGNNVVIKHQAIPGLMPAMTMDFSVRDRRELQGLRVGDSITFTVRATEEESWIEGIHKGAPGPPIPSSGKPPADLVHVGQAKPGDLLPDADMLDENGQRIRFSAFRGRALAFTFIFTRCPLPEFCPRMSRRFLEARDLLVERAPAVTNWQFLSLSFDPEFDTPEVLKGYAMNYRGTNSDRWLFAAASTNLTAAMAAQIDFRMAREGGSFVHNLRTVVLDCSGRIYRQFDGNQWPADELAQAMREAASRADNLPNSTKADSAARARLENGN